MTAVVSAGRPEDPTETARIEALKARRPKPPTGHPGWLAPDQAIAMPVSVELLGLDVMVTVMERLSPAERRRALAYLADRFGS